MPSLMSASGRRDALTRVSPLFLVMSLLVSVPMAASAQGTGSSQGLSAPSGSSGDWSLGAEVYLWGASLSSETQAGDKLDLGFDAIFNDLNLGFMGAFGARQDRLSLYADLIYLNLDDKQQTTANIVGSPLSVAAKVDLQGIISTFGAGYRFLETDRGSLEGLAGGRLLWLDSDLRFDVGSVRLRASDSSTNVDAIMGLRGTVDIMDDLYVVAYADVGTGQSDLTWQAWGTLNYRLDPVTLAAGYRYLAWDLDNNADVLSDVKLHGPILGVKFEF